MSVLIAVLLLTVSSNAQTIDVSQWLEKKLVDGKEIAMLRVPDTQFGAALVGPISFAQHSLHRLPDYYKSGSGKIDDEQYQDAEKYITMIEAADANFPVHHYRDEIKAFKELCIESAARAILKQKADGEAAFFKRLKSDFAWTSSDAVPVYSRPDAKSATIGKVGRLSFIRAYDVENNEEWVEAQIGEHTGYISRDAVAIDWEELAPTAADSTKLIRGAYYDFDPSPAYAAQLKKAAAEEERELRAANTAPRRKYYRGPKGGCYFINSAGNKQYVDHSNCR